jgi:hypothetical protein
MYFFSAWQFNNQGLFRIRKILDSVSKASNVESTLLRDSLPDESINIVKLLKEQVENYRSIFQDYWFLIKRILANFFSANG